MGTIPRYRDQDDNKADPARFSVGPELSNSKLIFDADHNAHCRLSEFQDERRDVRSLRAGLQLSALHFIQSRWKLMSNCGSAESRLIKEAIETLGAHLVSFLLAGYDELGIVHARCFEVLTQWRSLRTRKIIKISTGDACGLPRGEEPLVLLALVKLLNSNSDLVDGSKVITPTDEICSVLEWKTSSHTGAIIAGAIRKYFRASYLVAHDNQYSFPDMSGYSVSISRLIVAYAFANQSGIEDPPSSAEYVQVEFSQEIVDELRVASLLGMDWSRVTSLERQ